MTPEPTITAEELAAVHDRHPDLPQDPLPLEDNPLAERVAMACAKAEAETQDGKGVVSDHWRGRDFADGYDAGIEYAVAVVRAALTDPDPP